jgi:hypothetical protein
MSKLGDWRWYCGSDDADDEMSKCSDRDAAIKHGREAMPGNNFYIVEARMAVNDDREIAESKRETAPFAETRNGQFIKPVGKEVR